MSGLAPLSRQLHSLGETLAAQIEFGEFEALDAGKRAELRMLPCFLAGLADRVATLEAERDVVAEIAAAQARASSAGVLFGWFVARVTVIAGALLILWGVA